MDEDSKELFKAAAQVVLRPITTVLDDTIGVMGGDRLSAYRNANKMKWERYYAEEHAKVVEETDTPDLRMAAEILGEARDECRDEMLKVWAKLMVSLQDARRAQICRREFVEIVRGLEPLDAAVLPILADSAGLEPSRSEFIANRLSVSVDQVKLAFRNLLRLELVWEGSPPNFKYHPNLTILGRQFLAAVGS